MPERRLFAASRPAMSINVVDKLPPTPQGLQLGANVRVAVIHERKCAQRPLQRTQWMNRPSHERSQHSLKISPINQTRIPQKMTEAKHATTSQPKRGVTCRLGGESSLLSSFISAFKELAAELVNPGHLVQVTSHDGTIVCVQFTDDHHTHRSYSRAERACQTDAVSISGGCLHACQAPPGGSTSRTWTPAPGCVALPRLHDDRVRVYCLG